MSMSDEAAGIAARSGEGTVARAVAPQWCGGRRWLIDVLRNAYRVVGMRRQRGVDRLGGAMVGALLAGLGGNAACAGIAALTLTAAGVGGFVMTVAPTPAHAVSCTNADTGAAAGTDNGQLPNTACGNGAVAIGGSVSIGQYAGSNSLGVTNGDRTTSVWNTAVGPAAGVLVTGEENVAVGIFAGGEISGNNNVSIYIAGYIQHSSGRQFC